MDSREVGVTMARILSASLSALVCCGFAIVANAGEKFPGRAPDRDTIDTQQRVDKLVERGKYERAMLIYRHELAPLGDKYAQYMIGFLYLAGKGVDEDVVTAVAWYRLAAERHQETFVNEHDELWSHLDDEQKRRADEVYVALRGELGDAALIERLVKEDLARLDSRSRETPFAETSVSRSNFDRPEAINNWTVKQIRARMAYLEEKLGSDLRVIELERQRYKDLAALVEREIGALKTGR